MATPEVDGYSDLVHVGRGGFAHVYRARQDRFDRTVALKVLDVHRLGERGRRRFDHECKAMGSLSWHPHIVAVYDSGIADDGSPYLAMDYLHDGTLADRLAGRGRMAWADVVSIGIELAGALGAAHATGILHRDVKPENVLIGPFGEVQLSDFGIAAIEGATRTTTGHSSFTVDHVAPEILRGDPPDVRSDVYSLASTMHTLVHGTPPFGWNTDDSIAARISRVLTTPAPRLEGVPDELADLVQRALAKEPADRQPDAESFAEALQAVQREHGLAPTPLRLARGGPASSEDPTSSPDEEEIAEEPVGSVGAEEPDQEATRPREPDDGNATRPVVADPPAPGAGAPAPAEHDRRWRWRRPVVIGAVVLALLVAGVLLVATQGGGDSADEADGGGSGEEDLFEGIPTDRYEVVATVPVGDDPGGIAAGAGAIWVANYGDGTVSRIDPETNSAVATIDTGSTPLDVAVGAGAVWVSTSTNSSVLRIDPATNDITATVDVGLGAETIVADDDVIWVANGFGESVTRIDPAAVAVDPGAAVGPVVEVGGRAGPLAMGEGVLLVSVSADEGASYRVVVLDAATGSEQDDLALDAAALALESAASGLAPDHTLAWVAGSAGITEVDVVTGERTISTPLPEFPDYIVAADAVWASSLLGEAVMRVDYIGRVSDVVLDVPFASELISGDGSIWVVSGPAHDAVVARISPAGCVDPGRCETLDVPPIS